MNYFKDTNNKVFAYDDEQISQGYGKDLILLPSGNYYKIVDGKPEFIKYKLDDTYSEFTYDSETDTYSPQELDDAIKAIKQAEEETKALQVAKEAKVNALASVIVTVNGVDYDAHETAINNMSSVVGVAHTKYNQQVSAGMSPALAYELIYKSTIEWKGADNLPHQVQIESVVEALEQAMQKRAEIYGV